MTKNKGVLLVNLGSPDSTKVQDVRNYLREFLMDKRVIDVPFLIRKMIVELFILPNRPKKSAEAYRSIWWKEGSPLIQISKKLHKKVQEKLDIPVALGMRYGNPSIYTALQELADKGVQQVIVFPLYPQYAMSTTETVIEKTKEVASKHFPEMEVQFIASFYNDEAYITTLAQSIKEKLPTAFDSILFSYHGIPERHIYKTDPTKTCTINDCCFADSLPSHPYCYRHQCYTVTEKVRKKLELPTEKVKHSFQSRLGRDPWLTPYTDKTLESLPSEGIKNLVVVAPAFVSDCLETLEEIEMEGKHLFEQAGGTQFTYIPCLNDRDDWVDYIVGLIKSNTFAENLKKIS